MLPPMPRLTRYQARPIEKAAIEAHTNQPLLPDVQLMLGQLVFGLGGFGTLTAARLIALSVLYRLASIPVVYTMDNAGGTPATLVTPDGQTIAFPPPFGRHLHVDTGKDGEDRRTQLRRHALLRKRYEELGLLRGHPASSTGGYGGGGIPLMSMIDNELWIARLWEHIKSALRAASGQADNHAGGQGVLGRWARQQNAHVAPLDVIVLAGGCGSYGSATAPILGPMIRHAARELGMPTPRVWLVLAGPTSFKGFTHRTLLSWGVTMSTLQHLADNGIEHEFIDGTRLEEAAAPYERIFLIDDPQLPADGVRVSEADHEKFGWRVAALVCNLLRPEVRQAYLNEVVNGREGAENEWPGFIVAQYADGGFSHQLLRRQTEAESALQRARTLRQALAAAS